jgi:predicted CxxxxCH...CXXCH cytochrome family protein
VNPNNPHVPPTPAPGGTAPGCFNGTMCHNQAGHPAGWVATPPAAQPHGDEAKKDGTVAGQGFPSCQTCHGNNFAGTTVGPTCLNNATCHGAGVASPHAPKPWRGSPYTHTGTAEAGNAPVCYQCHAYTGTVNPNNPHVPPTPAPGGTAPGCFNGTMCHNEASHAVPFNTTTHYSVTNATFTANCGTCHAVTGTSPVSAAPLCTTCHIAGSPLTALSCTSCHANPPDSGAPMGASYPNIAGAHAKHLALGSIPGGTNVINCDTCHSALGSGTLAHYDRANARLGKNALRVPPGDVQFVSPFPYTAKNGGPATFDNSSLAALTCSAVKCHGGAPLAPTPNWRAGTINVTQDSDCRLCHNASGTAPSQYNDLTNVVFTEHTSHATQLLNGIACTVCHSTAQLTLVRHYGNLTDNTFPPGAARATIDNINLGWNPAPPVSQASCSGPLPTSCHR